MHVKLIISYTEAGNCEYSMVTSVSSLAGQKAQGILIKWIIMDRQ